MARPIGILGGTFDPIHCGHLDAGAAAMDALGLEHIEVIASNAPPHRSEPFASAYHRFAMVAMAVAGRAGWRASDFELLAAGPSYTATTLRRLHTRGHVPTGLVFIVGADAFLEIGTWKEYPAILDAAHFAVVSRPGCPVADLPARLPALAPRMSGPGTPGTSSTGDAIDSARPLIFLIDAPTADVSSTAIRQRCAEGRPIAGLVPDPVRQHIEQHELYRSTRHPAHVGSPAPAGRLHGED
jgi:nicotinate-nucleotide adenylyltransferase